MNKRRPDSPGYILLMTLVLLVLTGLVLVGLARQSLSVALEAAQVEQDMRLKWGSLSCRRTVLYRAHELFLDWPADFEADVEMSETIELNGLSYELKLADENAKVNVNRVGSLVSNQGLRELVRGLLPDSSEKRLKVSLRPDSVPRDPTGAPAFQSWGQVFDWSKFAARSTTVPEAVAKSTTQITCWGDGTLNVTRASDTVLTEFLQATVGLHAARQLVQARRFQPERLGTGLAGLRMPESRRESIRELFGNQSNCYSLWFTADTGQRKVSEYHVVQFEPVGDVRSPSRARTIESTASFAW